MNKRPNEKRDAAEERSPMRFTAPFQICAPDGQVLFGVTYGPGGSMLILRDLEGKTAVEISAFGGDDPRNSISVYGKNQNFPVAEIYSHREGGTVAASGNEAETAKAALFADGKNASVTLEASPMDFQEITVGRAK